MASPLDAGVGLGLSISAAKDAQSERKVTRRQRKFYTENIAYIRSLDLQRAGLNPILALTGGSPGLTGTVPGISPGSVVDPSQGFARGASAGAATTVANTGRQLAKADISLKEAQRQKEENLGQEAEVRAQTLGLQGVKTVAETQLLHAQLPYQQRLAELYSGKYGIDAATLKDTGIPGAAALGAGTRAVESGAKGLSKLAQYVNRLMGGGKAARTQKALSKTREDFIQ